MYGYVCACVCLLTNLLNFPIKRTQTCSQFLVAAYFLKLFLWPAAAATSMNASVNIHYIYIYVCLSAALIDCAQALMRALCLTPHSAELYAYIAGSVRADL